MSAVETTLPFRAAMESRDLGRIMACFAPGAVLRSPFTAGFVFTGRDQIAAAVEVILAEFRDLRYTQEARGDGTAFLVSVSRVGGQEIETADYLRLGPDGLIEEITIFFRPLPATAQALHRIAAALGRRRGRARGAVLSALTTPLAVVTRAGDPIGVRLIRSSL